MSDATNGTAGQSSADEVQDLRSLIEWLDSPGARIKTSDRAAEASQRAFMARLGETKARIGEAKARAA